MTSKERVLCAINHYQPDRVPIDFRFCKEKIQELKSHLQMSEAEVFEYIGQDVITIRPSFHKVATDIKYADPTVRIDDRGYYYDIYGVPFREINAMGQTYLELANEYVLGDANDIEALEAHAWPSADDWDYSDIHERILQHQTKAVWARSRGCFQTAQFLRGFDNFLMDMMTDEGYAKALMDHIYAFVREDARRTLEAGQGEYTFIEYNDDVATQRGMMISPELWRKMLRPYMEDFCSLVHSYGAYVRYHSCGSIVEIIEDLINIGVDILNPMQPLAEGMDPLLLKGRFGSRICFHGGLDTQRLLPEGTPDETRQQVRQLIDVAGKAGGYILAGSHTLQIDVRVENILAAADEALSRQ
jgi:uroporphyrinogen decarboxylase